MQQRVNRSHYQSKVFVCVSVMSGHVRIIDLTSTSLSTAMQGDNALDSFCLSVCLHSHG